ncbi:CYTH and CHAD domain-containing protein [Streptomyces sannanensis]|uniref:CYTH and CHAD domain-containing protein n=1 Tax=Streptomyces sannanensis TaxID=285536 RepID=A0ABP6S9I7_9ACTN
MADTKREIERKYEASADTRLPDLTRVAGVAAVLDKGVAELDAVYYDTPGLRLAADGITLRRRTGGDDAGWHLKFPVTTGIRDEIRAPLTDTLPSSLSGLLRSRIRDSELKPVVRLLSSREVRHLVDGDGTLLAELSVDTVLAERLTDGGATVSWTEIEVELADVGDPALLDAVDKRLRKADIRPSEAPSKLSRALAETGTVPEPPKKQAKPKTAGDHVLAYVHAQRDAIVELDPAVRRDLPDSVHRMRVATRRMRSVFRSYRRVLDRETTRPIGVELKWLAAELGVDRDREVLTERLDERLGELPEELVVGPVRTRLDTWSHATEAGSRERLTAVLDGKRYLTLLETLDVLLADPPLLPKSAGKPKKVIAKAVRRDHARLAAHIDEAMAKEPGSERDVALHESRKDAKRLRYAAEAAEPALGDPAADIVSAAKSLQTLLGDHQDSVMARTTLRDDLAVQAHDAGESTFTYGVLYGREEQRAAKDEAELPAAWAKAAELSA